MSDGSLITFPACRVARSDAFSTSLIHGAERRGHSASSVHASRLPRRVRLIDSTVQNEYARFSLPPDPFFSSSRCRLLHSTMYVCAPLIDFLKRKSLHEIHSDISRYHQPSFIRINCRQRVFHPPSFLLMQWMLPACNVFVSITNKMMTAFLLS